MLKIYPNIFDASPQQVKCAEIFFQSPMNFTIICTFCEIKAFEFDDFLLHFKNVHFENNLLKAKEFHSIKSESNTSAGFASNDNVGAVPGSNDTVNGNALESGTSSETEEVQLNLFSHNKCDNGYDSANYKSKKRLSSQKNKMFQCEHCEKHYKTEAILKYHIRKYHRDEHPLVRHRCAQCSKEFLNVRRLNAHIAREHGGFKCKHCDKKCRDSYDLRMHEVTHSGIKNFVCDFENCGKRFFTRRRLTEHRHIHEAPKNFVCETCGYSCRINAMLRVHYRTHTGEKPYACNMCDKRFKSSSLLNEHKPIHSTERPHVCDVCGATFSRPKALYHHKHLHLGIKKFKCKLCENAYAQAAGLAGHMRQHKQSAEMLPMS